MELINGPQILRLVAALAFVLALMAGLNLLMRRINAGTMPSSGQKRRLRVESMALDARRRLVLIRRDGREHLVILGPAGETVVESGIAVHEDAA